MPANQASCADLLAVFGTRGPGRCQCQRYKLRPREAFARFPVEERQHRLREQTSCGESEAPTTSGLVAFLDDDPVGWCAVEPRIEYQGMLRNQRVPWEGRTEDKVDPTVWAVTCLLVRAGFRRGGISRELARAAVTHARERGARAIEAYPMTTTANALLEELHVGTVATFAGAGFSEVSRPTVRRAVMRLELRPDP